MLVEAEAGLTLLLAAQLKDMRPAFPLRVRFRENGDEWSLDSEDEVAENLEWFNSADASENAQVWDANGRRVRIKVEALRVLVLELVDEAKRD